MGELCEVCKKKLCYCALDDDKLAHNWDFTAALDPMRGGCVGRMD